MASNHCPRRWPCAGSGPAVNDRPKTDKNGQPLEDCRALRITGFTLSVLYLAGNFAGLLVNGKEIAAEAWTTPLGSSTVGPKGGRFLLHEEGKFSSRKGF